MCYNDRNYKELFSSCVEMQDLSALDITAKNEDSDDDIQVIFRLDEGDQDQEGSEN